MAIAILVGKDKEEQNQYGWFVRDWKNALLKLGPHLDIRVWPHVGNKEEIDCALVWNHPAGILTQFPNLKVIASLAAGVDHVLTDTHLPAGVPIVRVVDPYMAKDIVQYVTAYVLNYIKRIDHWAAKQKESKWFKEPPFSFSDQTIGIMGLGFLGSKAAHLFQQLELKVIGWRNSPKRLSDIETFVGKEEFAEFLSRTHILVCMLPLTKETKNILNEKTFSLLPKGAFLLNVGRGDQLVEEDLLKALEQGQLSEACLDVFSKEPLPATHPFWAHPKIRVTPHIASVTNAETAALQVFENYQRALADKPLANPVDIKKGY